jgi:cysteine desulfuration protein SufE
MIPAPLQSIADLFAGLSENERRELLIHYAAGVARYAPQPGESFDVDDIRHDAECMDTVGVHVKVIGGRCHFRVSFGPEVQTLTRALTAILCEGLAGATAHEVLSLPDDIAREFAGAQLVRLRSRTVHYVFRRMKNAVASWEERNARQSR